MAKTPTTKTRNTAAGLISVTLTQPHTHDGEPMHPGATLTVTPKRAAWMQRHGLIETTQPDHPNPENRP